MNTTKGLIGVIVPIYKVEKYIAECIESILAQTYTSFRLILVDDGSPDDAGKICDEYAKKDTRITVIHQENAGVTRARARGVEETKDCEFITFIDGDDKFPNTALAILYSQFDNETDVVIGSHKCFDDNNSYTDSDSLIYPNNSLFADEFLTILFQENYNTENNRAIAPCCWGKLYRRTLFNNSTFNLPRNIVISEDLIMNIHIGFNLNKKVKTIDQFIYYYRIYSNSTFHSHIRTFENEFEIHTCKIRSIPEPLKNKYVPKTIPIRLYRYWEFGGYSYHIKQLKNSKFYKSLKSDIESHHIQLPFIDKLIFHTSNPILRFIFVNIKKMKNKLSLDNKI